MGKLVEMRETGGEVSSVVSKNNTLPFIGQPTR